jgi:dihydroorotate dehydrogenase electron transfer subunit
MFSGKALITENTVLGPGYYRLTVLAPEVATLAKPGQFIQIRIAALECNDPLLPRPISIFRINETTNKVSLIYKVIGRGTSMIAGLKPGELVEILGPIGNGFTLPDNAYNIALIAGGVGMPPLFCFAEYVKQHSDCRSRIALFYGGRKDRDLLELDLWGQTQVGLFIATEDGSMGERGFVTETFIKEHRRQRFDYIAACGPQVMLQAVQKIALVEGISGQLSLEANMACGVGACLGCTCETNQGYKRVCVDGPVFPMQEVVWP